MKTRSMRPALLVIGIALALPQAGYAMVGKCEHIRCTSNTEEPKGIPEAFVPREIDRAPETSVPADQDILNLESEPAGHPT